MAYEFKNQKVAKATINDGVSTSNLNLAGVNGEITDANVIMEGLTQLLNIAGWTIADAQRVVTQDIEETA